MYIFRIPIYNKLLKNNNNNKRRFFSSNINNNLDVIDHKLNVINENIKGLYILSFTNMFVSVCSLFS
jgi:hypothetical protein